MQKEVKRAVKSEPEAFDREQYTFKKEDNGGVDDMKDDIREEDVEESLHGVDMLGMSNRAGGARNLFANSFLAEGDVVMVFADKKYPLDFPFWLALVSQAKVAGSPKSIMVHWYEPFSPDEPILSKYYRCFDSIPTSSAIIGHESV